MPHTRIGPSGRVSLIRRNISDQASINFYHRRYVANECAVAGDFANLVERLTIVCEA